MGKKTVFLDRDGTINKDFEYVFRPERIELVEQAGKALGSLVRAGFQLVIVSNQSAIGRGMCDTAAVDATNAELTRQLREEDPDALISRILYCPHSPDEKCSCRKPGIAMVSCANPVVEFDRIHSWMIGDKTIDMEFGRALGLTKEHCLLLKTDKDVGVMESAYPFQFVGLLQAVNHILNFG